METIPNFLDNYEMLVKASRVRVSTDSIRICLFCGESEPVVTFKKKAHIVPELLGKNDLIYHQECDTCNGEISKYESHLATFISPYLPLLGIRTKDKVPMFQSRKENDDDYTFTQLKFEHGSRELIVDQMDDYVLDPKSKTFTINFRRPPLRPKWVYKALVRIGLSFLPEELRDAYLPIYRWIVSEEMKVPASPWIFQTTLHYRFFGNPFATLFKAKNEGSSNGVFPQLVLIVGFGNVIYQVHMPFTEQFVANANNRLVDFRNVFFAFCYDDLSRRKNIKIDSHFLGDNNTVKYDQKMYFTYESLDGKITSTEDKYET